MPIIRKQLKPGDVYPADIRYDEATDKVQRFIDGVWKDAPESDPRTQTTLPPRITSDSRCDAAHSIVDALKNQISEILTAIDNGATAFTIAGLILGLFTFGVFGIFIALALFIADQMLAAGSGALEAALTEAVWDQLVCILYCNITSDGRIKKGSLPTIISDVNSQIGGLAATIINAMLSLAGEGGLSNIAAKGTSTGTCPDCGCDDLFCYIFDFENVSDGGWSRTTAEGDNNGTYGVGGWLVSDAINTVLNPDVAQRLVNIKRDFASTRITKYEMTFALTKGTFDVPTAVGLRMRINGSAVVDIPFNLLEDDNVVAVWEGDMTGVVQFQAFIRVSRDQSSPYAYSGAGVIKSIKVEGYAPNPFGTDNCP